MMPYQQEYCGLGIISEEYGGYDEGPIRRFDPEYSYPHCDIPDHQLITYNPSKGISQLRIISPRTGAIVRDNSTAVIHIDGACRGNGTPYARGAWGVYCGPRSPFNSHGLLPMIAPQTSGAAEIHALIVALDMIEYELLPDLSISQIFIVSDSSYLVQAMSEWMEFWLENGGRNSRGQRVAHWEVLRDQHYRIEDMTYGEGGGLDFKFWHVPREMNWQADELANHAFRRQ
ncbi:hypothetical protein FSARC_10024 [Fusarium sarcochroum]|uniref:ribonuclease H n=1 Tax=Fusarium sarcochroum TaxID=1208366 RepID=A0A8H4TPU8_9HYPO|nr:hypothetical protein FSARC_10024 [Fusarium sarcochroum]